MNHRVVNVVVIGIVAVLLGTALAFAASIQARVPAGAGVSTPGAIPHPVTGRNADCISCHNGTGVPLTHRYFTTASCFECHATRAIIEVPHSVAMGSSRCPLCHGDPNSDFGMPADHFAFKEKHCLFCHVGDPTQTRQPPPAGESAADTPTLTHPISGAFRHCLYCHRIGSVPNLPRTHEAFSQETCLWCHLPADGSGARNR